MSTALSCNQCHSDRDAAWAVAAMGDWGVKPKIRATQARMLARAWQGDSGVFPDLIALANEGGRPAILRATATLELGSFPS